MKTIRIITKTLILLSVNFQINLAQENLYTPLEFQKAYEEGTRSTDGKPGVNYWQNYAKYTIDAEIITKESILVAKEKIIYINNSPDTIRSITVQLHQDMYKKGNPRDSYVVPSDITDGLIIRQFQIEGEDIDLDNEQFVQREKSLLKIKLEKALIPNSSVQLSMDWQFHIPEKTYIRYCRYDSTSYFIAYWFPRIAVYDDIFDWDDLGYDGGHEFNNDYADFSVNIKVPENYCIWASGDLLNPDEVYPKDVIENLKKTNNKGVTTIFEGNSSNITDKETTFKIWRFKADNMKDFSFGISDHHIWEATKLVKNNDEIFIHVVYDPELKKYFEGTASFFRTCMEYYFDINPGVPYPHSSYTAFNGLRAGWHHAIEFPTISNYSVYEDTSMNYSMFAHEYAHIYHPFLVNINEARFGWMDEGLTTYLEYEIMRNVLNREKFDVYTEVSTFDEQAGTFFDVPPFIPSYMYHEKNDLLTNFYRSSYLFLILEDMLGKEVFVKCYKAFINRWKGKRPIPHDLFNTFNDVSGQNLNWFWKAWIFDFVYPDLSIREIKDNRITIENIGGLPVPVSLKITFSDNSVKEIYKTAEVWKGNDKAIKISFDDSKQVKKLELSDNYLIPDVNRSNNIYIVKN